jgi:hypothetical protein
MIKKAIGFVVFSTAFIFAQVIGPKISVLQSDYSFGDIIQGEKVAHNFTITNSGGDMLKITDIKASCGCTAAVPEKSELKPGESTQIKVEFNSQGRRGDQVKYVYIRTNDEKNPEVKLRITGTVVPKKGNEQSSLQK